MWEELAACKGMRYPHLHKAQEVVSERNQVEAGSKMHGVSLSSVYAMQTWEAVHETVGVETWAAQCRHTSAQPLKPWTKQKPQICVGHSPVGRCHLPEHTNQSHH